MRLIDVDVLKDRIYLRWGCDPAYYKDPEAEEASRILEDIEECPPVEAITISFLDEYIGELYHYCKEWEKRGFNRLYTQRYFPIMKDTLEEIIRLWRIRNGQQ